MHRRTPRPSLVLLLLIGAAAACSHADSPADSRADSPATSRAASVGAASRSAGADAPLDLCTVMPASVVSQVLQARIGKGVSVATPHTGGMCDYKDVDRGVPGVEVLIDFTAHETAADATTAYQGAHKQAGDMGLALADVPGIADDAFGSTDAPESYGVKAHRGRYMGQVNVRAQGISSDALRPAATELVKLTLARLP